MLYQVVFSPEALAQMEALYGYVAQDRCRHGHTRRRTRGLDARKLGHAGLWLAKLRC
jgi:hypothetical protein